MTLNNRQYLELKAIIKDVNPNVKAKKRVVQNEIADGRSWSEARDYAEIWASCQS